MEPTIKGTEEVPLKQAQHQKIVNSLMDSVTFIILGAILLLFMLKVWARSLTKKKGG